MSNKSALFQALDKIGLEPDQIGDFLCGNPVVYPLPTQGDPGVGMIQIDGTQLRSGIIEINDPGGGLKDLILFRERSRAVAEAAGASEMVLFAAEVINLKLRSVLERQGFRESNVPVPEMLGGGTMEILAKSFPIVEPGGQ